MANEIIFASVGIDEANRDFTIFALLFVGVGLGFSYWMHRHLHLGKAWPVIAVVTAGMMIAAWYKSNGAGNEERNRLMIALQGLADTYAGEMVHLEHERVHTETATDDPVYLSLIAAQKRWLSINRQINDVYTFRKNDAGDPILMVDSETDYDHNGQYEGENEARTQIGEPWDDDDPSIDVAFSGKATFSPTVTQDRWGTWYSIYSPLIKSDGSIDGVLGIDLDAHDVIDTVHRTQTAILSHFAVLYLAFITFMGGVGAVVLGRRSLEEKDNLAQVARQKDKLENLVSSLEGAVWESGVNPASHIYVSVQVEKILGWASGYLVEDDKIWERNLHPDDRSWAIETRKRAVEDGKIYTIEYRMSHQNGTMVCIRERGSVHEGDAGKVLRGVMTDITQQKEQNVELERAQKQLVESSRQAGMAEVATGVLHNVGNVLNSVNIAGSVISETIRKSSLPTLKSVAQILLAEQDISGFMATSRGQAVPAFLRDLHSRLDSEQNGLHNEVKTLKTSIEHIKEIIMMQQDYARMGGKSTALELNLLVDDALNINAASISNHRIRVVKDYQSVAMIQAERNKVLQILVNLIRNAKHALDEGSHSDRILTIRIERGGDELVNVVVSDNGVGICAENLHRLFSYGFTTRKTGHGFGLHSSVNTAREMGGGLTAFSEGTDCGATFILSLPIAIAITKTFGQALPLHHSPIPAHVL